MKKNYIEPRTNACSSFFTEFGMLVSSPGSGDNTLGETKDPTLDPRTDEGIGLGNGDALSKGRGFYSSYE